MHRNPPKTLLVGSRQAPDPDPSLLTTFVAKFRFDPTRFQPLPPETDVLLTCSIVAGKVDLELLAHDPQELIEALRENGHLDE